MYLVDHGFQPAEVGRNRRIRLAECRQRVYLIFSWFSCQYNPKYQTDREKLIQNKDKERDSDKSSVYVGQGSYLEKDTKQREKDYEEYEKLRIKKQQSRVLSLFSLIGEVNGKIKIKDLIEKGELDSNTVNSIIDEIDKNKSLVVGFYSSYEKDRAQEKIDSYIRKGILDSDIVKYITSKLPNS